MLNSLLFILFLMFFAHIVDDYYLQGILASLKQKSWWRKQESYSDKYKNDYKVALGCHAFSWAFMTMLPLALFTFSNYWCIFVVVNAVVHYFVDDLKANQLKINLIQDQFIHFAQLILSWLVYGLIFS